jgi:hypothetical protein
MSVIRPGTIIWFCIVVAVGYAMFQVKYEVMQQEQTLASLNRQISEGREQIRVLNAEWSYLTRPSRLEELSTRFLHLNSMNSAQILPLSTVPERPDPSAPATAAPAVTPTASKPSRLAAVTSRAER